MHLTKYGHACGQGPRKEMQDVVLVNQLPDQTHQLAVFDGHNPEGDVFAERAAETTGELVNYHKTTDSPADIARMAGRRWTSLHDKLKEEYPRTSSGTTATLAVVKRANVAVTYVGDSEAAFYPDSGGMVPLTKPHDGSNQKELDRVKSLGYRTMDIGGVTYFNGQLAVSRAIGDFSLGFVIPEASITLYRFREPGDLVVGTDGIWGHHVTEAYAVEEIVQSHRPKAVQAIANDLADLGWQNGDNASAIVARIE